MLDFKSYLIESDGQGIASAKHQEHPEDTAITSRSGFEHSVSTLKSIHQGLKTGNSEDTHISTKLDGAPAIVYGHHPKTGKFFVATKHSAYGKTPKHATTHAEVDQHFGHSPGLAQKMHSALEHLPKIAPKKGVYQGDFMHDSSEIKHEDHEVSFKPNTIRYHIDKNTPEGKKAIKSKIGFATHTQIHGNPDHPETLHASPLKDASKFKNHSDVHHISAHMTLGKGGHIDEKEGDHVEQHLKKAEKIHNDLHSSHHDIINKHAEHVSTYINQTVRTGEKPSPQGLRKHIQNRMQKDVDKMKTSGGKQAKIEKLNTALIHHDTHEDHFSKALQIHHHIQQAKNTLVSGLNKATKNTNPMRQTIDNKETDPEGHVVQHKGQIVKMVNRQEFSKANFAPKEWKK